MTTHSETPAAIATVEPKNNADYTLEKIEASIKACRRHARDQNLDATARARYATIERKWIRMRNKLEKEEAAESSTGSSSSDEEYYSPRPTKHKKKASPAVKPKKKAPPPDSEEEIEAAPTPKVETVKEPIPTVNEAPAKKGFWRNLVSYEPPK